MEGGAGRATRVREFMSATPPLLRPEDSSRAATDALRERGLRALPIVDVAGGRHLVGCVRAARILSLAVRESRMTTEPAGRLQGGDGG
jgi:CBS domain-containing protein